MKTQIFPTYADFLKREDTSANGVSPEFAESNPDYEEQQETNQGCWDCKDCKACEDCDNCEDCEDCWDCDNCEDCDNCKACWDCEE